MCAGIGGTAAKKILIGLVNRFETFANSAFELRLGNSATSGLELIVLANPSVCVGLRGIVRGLNLFQFRGNICVREAGRRIDGRLSFTVGSV